MIAIYLTAAISVIVTLIGVYIAGEWKSNFDKNKYIQHGWELCHKRLTELKELTKTNSYQLKPRKENILKLITKPEIK